MSKRRINSTSSGNHHDDDDDNDDDDNTKTKIVLDPETSIIAIIGGGISGLVTALQILVDQTQQINNNNNNWKKKQLLRPPPPPHHHHRVTSTNESRCSSNRSCDINAKNDHFHHCRRICHTIRIYEKCNDPNTSRIIEATVCSHHHHHRPNGSSTARSAAATTTTNPTQIGYGLTITYQPNGLLHQLGILDDITNHDCPSRSHHLLNANGTILGYYGNAFASVSSSSSTTTNSPSSSSTSSSSSSPTFPNSTTDKHVTTTEHHAGGGGGGGGYGQRGNIRIPRQTLCHIILQRILSFTGTAADVPPNTNNDRNKNGKNGFDDNNFNDHQYPNVEFYYNHTLRSIQEIQNDENDSDDASKISQNTMDMISNVNPKTAATTTTKKTRKLLQLSFTNDHTTMVDLVIAADGIHSTVVRQWLQPPSATTTTKIPSTPTTAPLLRHPPPQSKSLNVRVILGITNDLRNVITATASTIYTVNGGENRVTQHQNQHHELLQERGFYTLSNGHRLFVMPYTGSALNRSLHELEPIQFMWQLSFPSADDDEKADGGLNKTAIRYTASELKAEALRRTKLWHDPVATLIQNTSIEQNRIWGTMLRDRDPSEIGNLLLQKDSSNGRHKRVQRVIIIGDAIHGMSPFKGQGANQCFKDAVCVSKWLYKMGRRNLSTSVQFITREIIQRTAPIVTASRAASQYWHVLDNDTKYNNTADFAFAGIDDPILKQQVLHELQCRHINAGTTQNLDESIRTIIRDVLRQHQLQQNGPMNGYGKGDGVFYAISADQDNIDSTSGRSIPPPATASNNKTPGEKVAVVVPTTITAICDMAYTGDTGGLRKISWYKPNYLRELKILICCNDDCQSSADTYYCNPLLRNGLIDVTDIDCDECASTTTTLLHIAVLGGNIRTIHWLVTEAGCHIGDLTGTFHGRHHCTSLDLAKQMLVLSSTSSSFEQQQRHSIVELLLRLQSYN